MIVKCTCNKTEYHELIKQLKDEGLYYRATIQTTLDKMCEVDFQEETYQTIEYFVVFCYSGKLI